MPHVIIECSENLLPILQQQEICKKAFDVLVNSGLFKAADIKTRLHPAVNSYVGLKGEDGSFTHAIIYLLEGRPPDAQKSLMMALCSVLRQSVPEADSVTVDISEMQRAFYQKF